MGSHTTTRGETAAMSAELLQILSGLDMESLLQAHDQAASLLDLTAFSKKQKVRVFCYFLISSEHLVLLQENIYSKHIFVWDICFDV